MTPRRPDTLFWAEPDAVGDGFLSLDAEESHHLLRVHRAEEGTPFEATDGTGVLYRCRLTAVSAGMARGEIVERVEEVGELPGAIRLLVGLPDVRAVEAVVEHAVPLGVASIVFVTCERSERRPLGTARRNRLRRLAVAGVKQSRRSRLPSVATAGSLAEALDGSVDIGEGAGGPAGRYFADPEGAPAAVLQESGACRESVALVGPPGGFTTRERVLVRSRRFGGISLGNNRLTTETAAIALLCAVRAPLLEHGRRPI